MEIPEDISSAIHDALLKAKNILLISHRNPDADTVGSNIALRLVAEPTGIRATSCCAEPLHPQFHFLPLTGTFRQKVPDENFDTVVCVDCGSPEQTSFLKDNPHLAKKRQIINIDHHPTNTHYGKINLVMEEAASATQIIFRLFEQWGTAVTPDIATCLLAGLYTDTGSFMHSNTCEEVLDDAGKLTSLGADRASVVKNLFKQSSPEKLLLLGKILETANMTEKNVVISALRNEDISACGAEPSEIGGAIDYLNSVKGTRIAALLSEDGNGNIRGSLRTKDDDINLSEIAKKLGGGGHKKASGFTIKGKLQKEVHWTILPD